MGADVLFGYSCTVVLFFGCSRLSINLAVDSAGILCA